MPFHCLFTVFLLPDPCLPTACPLSCLSTASPPSFYLLITVCLLPFSASPRLFAASSLVTHCLFHWLFTVFLLPVPEFIDPVFTKTSPKRSFSLNRKRAFWLVFAKTGSIISGTDHCLSTAFSLPLYCLITACPLCVHCISTASLYRLSTAWSLPVDCLSTAYPQGGLLPFNCVSIAYLL